MSMFLLLVRASYALVVKNLEKGLAVITVIWKKENKQHSYSAGGTVLLPQKNRTKNA